MNIPHIYEPYQNTTHTASTTEWRTNINLSSMTSTPYYHYIKSVMADECRILNVTCTVNLFGKQDNRSVSDKTIDVNEWLTSCMMTTKFWVADVGDVVITDELKWSAIIAPSYVSLDNQRPVVIPTEGSTIVGQRDAAAGPAAWRPSRDDDNEDRVTMYVTH